MKGLLRPADWALLAAAFGGLGLGLLWPAPGLLAAPYTAAMMATVLFLAFLPMDFGPLMRLDAGAALEACFWTAVKLLALPLLVWAALTLAAPRWAVPGLLLSGVSAGVTSPFFAGLLGADMAMALRLVVVSSLLAPLSLPALVGWLAGGQMQASYGQMAGMLAVVIFLPLGLAWALRRFAPAVASGVIRRRRPITLLMFFCVNSAVAAQYRGHLLSRPADLLETMVVAGLLALVFGGLGLGLGWLSRDRLDGLTGAASMAFCNNILALVFAERFFGADAALLCAVYTLPYFLMLIPLRLAAGRAIRSHR